MVTMAKKSIEKEYTRKLLEACGANLGSSYAYREEQKVLAVRNLLEEYRKAVIDVHAHNKDKDDNI